MSESTTKFYRENSVKMVLNTGPVVSSNPQINSGLSSPTGETCDENPNKLITYLHQLAGSYEVEVDVIMKDHCYARPWNWKPENVYVKPIKKLFFSKSQNVFTKDTSNQEEFIDVEEVDPEPVAPPFDFIKVRQSMNEFQRVANFVRPDDADDWEEKIDKILWSPVQNRIFNKVVRILNSERVTRLAKSNNVHEPILRRTSIDTTAKRFRETLASANWDWRITQWLHSLMFDYLPQEYLTIYLDILQCLRQKIPQLIDKMIAAQPNINSKGGTITWETLGPLLKKSWDPVGPALNANRPKKLPGNPILIVTPNGMSSNVSSRQHKWIAQLGALGTVITVNPHLGLTANRMTVIAGIEQLVQACRAKIQDVRVDFPGRPIILVGMNTGSAVACQIGQMEHVTAIICLGFPFNTVDGKRGAPDDSLLDVRCPVIFVIGQNSMLARVDDMEDLRERMLVPTSLVVVGSADDHLRISTSKKISEKISQSVVDRCILDEIGDFVGGILLQPHPLPLRSPSMLNNYENRNKRADGRKRKNSTSSSVDSEPQSPNLKKLRPHSPQQGNIVTNNVTGISTNMLHRGTLVALTGTTATQTPRRKPRTSFANQNFSEQLITSRLTSQQQNIENTSGGITLNIGSFASLAPVGPIRFEPASISLQTSSSGKASNTLKASNAFIKVSKNNQVNISGGQNVTKIKMIMPTKKLPQKTANNYKNINISEKSSDVNMVNVLTPTSAPLRINAPTATVTNMKVTAGNVNMNTLPTIHPSKNQANAGATLMGKTVSSSSILFTPKSSPAVTTTATSSTLAKVADISVAGGSRKPTIYPSNCQQNQQHQQQQQSNTSDSSHQHHSKLRSPKTRPITKISFKSVNRSPPQSGTQIQEKDIKMCAGAANTIQEYSNSTCKSQISNSLDDELGNILDIPIIIANDGENLNNLEKLPRLPQAPITLQSNDKSLPIMGAVGNKVVFINNKSIGTSSNELQQSTQSLGLNQVITSCAQNTVTFSRSGTTATAQPTIKYTKIILTKRNDHEDKSNPVILTKTNRRANKLLVVDSNCDVKYAQGAASVSTNYLGELQNSARSDNLNAVDPQYDSNILKSNH